MFHKIGLRWVVFVIVGSGGRAWADETVRVSVDSSGTQGNGDSLGPYVSGDGRRIVFVSRASNLVPNDTNGVPDVFVRDEDTQTTMRVSVSSSGDQANGGSDGSSISLDGRYASFRSGATNLVADDTNGSPDSFVHDLVTGQTTRVNVDSNGQQANGHSWYSPSLSADGRMVAFISGATNLVPNDTNGVWDVFVRDRQAATTIRVSVSSSGEQGNDLCYRCRIAAGGQFVTFSSWSNTLVPGDTNGAMDIFVHDLATGQTTRVNVSSAGDQANASCDYADLSADGRYVSFSGEASNLVPDDTNVATDVFVHDRQTGETRRVSVSTTGSQGNGFSAYSSMSADGRYVGFASDANLVEGDTNDRRDTFRHDLTTGETVRVSLSNTGAQSNGASLHTVLSADGSKVAFPSRASNLVVGDTNGEEDIFLRIIGPTPPPRPDWITQRLSVDSAGGQADNACADLALSGNGRFLAFSSGATNLVGGDLNDSADVFVQDWLSHATERVSVDSSGVEANGDSRAPCVSARGRYVTFASLASNLAANDANSTWDVFVHDRSLGMTSLVSPTLGGGAAGNGSSEHPRVSADGQVIAFSSLASDLVLDDGNGMSDVFVFDFQRGLVERVSVDSAGLESDGNSSLPSISGDGRYIAFESYATNLAPGDTNGVVDVFVHDRSSGQTIRASVDSNGLEVSAGSSPGGKGLMISSEGRFVAFVSESGDLVSDDMNSVADIFVRDTLLGKTTRVSVDYAGEEADAASELPRISADGQRVSFQSDATNLVVDDTNGVSDVFLHDLQTMETWRVSVDSSGMEADARSGAANAITLDGRYVSFLSEATNLTVDDTNGTADVFLHGPELSLDAVPITVAPGDLFTLATWRGSYQDPALLFVTHVDGAPFLMRVTTGTFDPLGNWIVSLYIPFDPVLSGISLTFQAFGLGPYTQRVQVTNLATVEIQ